MTDTDTQAPTVADNVQPGPPPDDPNVPKGQALTIRADLDYWTPHQRAALAQLGVKDATHADMAIYLEFCKRSGLSPFARQVYMIMRRVWDNDAREWVPRQTIQVGIDGFRVVGHRAARRQRDAVGFDDTVWYDSDGNERKVWLEKEPPAACRVVLRVNGQPYPAVLRTAAYMATNKEGKPTGQWGADSQPDHMIEKCCEAFAWRRAYPNDLGNAYLPEEMDVHGMGYEPPVTDAPAQPAIQAAPRRRPDTAATVAPADPEPPAEEEQGFAYVEPGTPAEQQATGHRWNPQPFVAEQFDRDKARKAMRALLGKAQPSLNREADKPLRLAITGLIAAIATAPRGSQPEPLWLESSDDLDDEQFHGLVQGLQHVWQRTQDGAAFRAHLEQLAQDAERRAQASQQAPAEADE